MYKELLPFPPFRNSQVSKHSEHEQQITYLNVWILVGAAYVRDVWERLPQLIAAATSVYGTILKIDSTNKICKKLQGAAAGIASWITNIGNELGEVTISVLTESEDSEALRWMACGVMEQCEMARQDPPRLLHRQRLLLYKRPLQVPGQ